MLDSTGNWPQWTKNAANWVNNNIIQPVANFFSPSTNTISGQFQEGIFRGSGKDHGGGHWDVQSTGGGYANVYPKGGVSSGKIVNKQKPYPKIPIYPR